MTNEDTVQCFFFPLSSSNTAECLERLCEGINNTIQILSEDYIWHRDEFKVHIPIEAKNDDIPPHLSSTTCFGDNIEDEWFIVYLVFEITKQFKDIVAQIKDSDGDFLLIEAANHLPSWANPDNTENRVFIYDNQIHLIPPQEVDINSECCLNEAIKIVVDSKIHSEAKEVQQAILKRINNYPAKIKEHAHRAIVNLPIDLATLLTLKPALISPIVTTFCNSDVIDARGCKNVKFENCTLTEVKFTKCLYAMLIHSKLIKTIHNVKIIESDKKNVLGLKLTCGYEMIMNRLSQDIFSSEEYKKFIKSLVNNGYFKDNIEGSQGYAQLLDKAKKYFLSIECPINSYVCNNISQILHSKEFLELKRAIENKNMESDFTEDSEDWLNINSEQLDDFLITHYGKQIKLNNHDITSETITSALSDFLKKSSDLEGIETGVEKYDSNIIEFDTDEFVDSLENMLKLVSTDCSTHSDFSSSDDDDDNNWAQEEPNDLDVELQSKLKTCEKEGVQTSKQILLNMIQSMKEEKASSGPSSNLLRSIGINKTDILDSDDDEI